MKKGDKCILKSDVLTIVDKQCQDARTGITKYVCQNSDGSEFEVSASELVLLEEGSENLDECVDTKECVDAKVNVNPEVTLDHEVPDSKTFLSKDKRQNK